MSWQAWLRANARCRSRRVFVGLVHDELRGCIERGDDFLYFDHGYWKREKYFRCIVGATHLTRLLDRPADRDMPRLAPFRGGGRQVVVIPPSGLVEALYRAHLWLPTTLQLLAESTDRPIVVKHKDGRTMRDACTGAHAVVTFGSVAGVEAAILGYPVFSGPICPTLPISAGKVSDIENPVEQDREPWLRSLSYAQWKMEEIERLNLKEYEYSCA